MMTVRKAASKVMIEKMMEFIIDVDVDVDVDVTVILTVQLNADSIYTCYNLISGNVINIHLAKY